MYKNESVDKKRISIFILVFLLILFIISNFLFGGKIKQLKKDFSNDDLLNKVIVVYSKDNPLDKSSEKNLKKLSRELKFDIRKIEYNDKLNNIIQKQGELYKSLQPKIEEIEVKVKTNQKDNNILNEISNLFSIAITKQKNKENISKEINEITTKSSLSEDEVKNYIKYKIDFENITFSGSIDNTQLPMVLVIKKGEVGRFVISSSERETLKTKLQNNRISLLNERNVLKNVLKYNMKQKNFVVMYGNGYNTNLNMVDTYIKEGSDQYNFDYIYIDITSIGNEKFYKEYMSKGYTNNIITTPTIVTYVKGKEYQRIQGNIQPSDVNNLISSYLNKTKKS